MRLFHILMTLIVHADADAQGYFGIVKNINKPRPVILEDNKNETKNIYDFHVKNAIVAIDEIHLKPPLLDDDILIAKKKLFPFNYHEILNCDLRR